MKTTTSIFSREFKQVFNKNKYQNLTAIRSQSYTHLGWMSILDFRVSRVIYCFMASAGALWLYIDSSYFHETFGHFPQPPRRILVYFNFILRDSQAVQLRKNNHITNTFSKGRQLNISSNILLNQLCNLMENDKNIYLQKQNNLCTGIKTLLFRLIVHNMDMLKKHNKSDCLLKLLLIGNSHVGKSCMLLRYTENLFTNNFYNTIGVDFVIYYINNKKTKILLIDNKTIKLQIWDTAGQDRFKTITNNYYRGAHGVMIVFDVTDKSSFENIKQWMVDIDKYASDNINKILIGNKSDISDKRKVTVKEGQQLASKYGIKYLETSAKTAQNIESSFQTIAKEILDTQGNDLLERRKSSVITGNSRIVLGQEKKPAQQQHFQKQQQQEASKGCC